MIIVGSGHVAVPLAEIAVMCEFAVTVIDDRPEYANRERFPSADQIIVSDPQQAVRDIDMDEDTYVVLVTRGHVLDVACLVEIINRPLAYIGMIGSKRRVRGVFELLEQEYGIDMEKAHRVYAPIGLPLAARTPAEIAVSIMGEVINVFRGGAAASFSDGQRDRTSQEG
jgi:xanthine dehydrogenase accessory factor